MHARWWGALMLLVYGLIAVVNIWLSPPTLPIFWRIAEYALLATVLLGFLARQFPQAGSLIWRPVMIFIGAAMAAAEVSAWSRQLQLPFSTDQWMTALIGLAGVAIVARMLPQSILSRWLGAHAIAPQGGEGG